MNQLITENIKAQAWLLLAFGKQSDYAGNLGYSDKLSEVYQYDSSVPNHRQIRKGDIVLLRDKTNLLGVARSERIEVCEGKKTKFRCPKCRHTNIKALKMKTGFRCAKCSNHFCTPISEDKDCLLYTIHFDNSFVSAKGAVSIEALKNACFKYNGQMAMQLINLQSIKTALLENAPEVSQLLVSTSEPGYITAVDFDEVEKLAETEGYFEPKNIIDARNRIITSIVRRQGQPQFRQQLLQVYNSKCTLTACDAEQALEAAHIIPFRGYDTNHPSNGLLLRADIHTLFDLHLLSVNPYTMTAEIAPSLYNTCYRELRGKPLQLPVNEIFKPNRKAIEEHHKAFFKKIYLSSDRHLLQP